MVRIREKGRETLVTMDAFEKRVRSGELSPLSEVCIPALTGDEFVQARTLEVFNKLYDPRRIHFKMHFAIDRFPTLTLSICLLFVGVFFVTRYLGEGEVTRHVLLWLGAKANPRILEDGEAWRLLAANLLHRDGLHLGFNIFAFVVVSSVLEGVYRRSDLMLLVVASGIFAMLTSLLLGASVTVGASGIVFGCLGCAVLFGWRYSDILPLRYRVYFGGIVVLYSAAMFYIGLQNKGTDNWGHAGGFICGVACGVLFTPRLLRLGTKGESNTNEKTPWLVALALALATFLVGPILAHLYDESQSHMLDAFGIQFEHSKLWTRRADHDGLLTFSNGVDAFSKLGCATLDEPTRLEHSARRFVDDELNALVQQGRIARLQIDVPARDSVGQDSASIDALRVPFSFVAEDGEWRAQAFLFGRGQIECALVLGHSPKAPAKTKDRLLQLKRSLRQLQTKAQRTGAKKVARDLESGRAHLALALAHQQAGQYEAARASFAQSETLSKKGSRLYADVVFARARFEHAFTGDTEHARLYAARAFSVQSFNPEAGLLLVDALEAFGDRRRALLLLERLKEMHPQAADVDAKIQTLSEKKPR